MSFIHFNCPSCGKAIKFKAEDAGKQGKCSDCNHTIHVPQASESQAADILRDTKKSPSPKSYVIPATEKTEEKVPVAKPSEKGIVPEEDRAFKRAPYSENLRCAVADGEITFVSIFSVLGGMILVAGIVAEVYAFNMVTTIEGVLNAGLLHKQMLILNTGIGMTVVGILAIIGGLLSRSQLFTTLLLEGILSSKNQ